MKRRFLSTLGFEPTSLWEHLSIVGAERSRVRILLVTYLFFNKRNLHAQWENWENFRTNFSFFLHSGIRTHNLLDAFSNIVTERSWVRIPLVTYLFSYKHNEKKMLSTLGFEPTPFGNNWKGYGFEPRSSLQIFEFSRQNGPNLQLLLILNLIW